MHDSDKWIIYPDFSTCKTFQMTNPTGNPFRCLLRPFWRKLTKLLWNCTASIFNIKRESTFVCIIKTHFVWFVLWTWFGKKSVLNCMSLMANQFGKAHCRHDGLCVLSIHPELQFAPSCAVIGPIPPIATVCAVIDPILFLGCPLITWFNFNPSMYK